MNNDLFINSIRVLVQNWELILAILACVSWGTLLTFATLKKITVTQFTDAQLTALALGGWPLPALAISVLLLTLHLLIPAGFISVVTVALFAVSTGLAIRAVWKHVSSGFIIPVFIFLFFVFIRLGFSANAVLPPYFDSAEHYRIIQSLVNIGDVKESALNEMLWPTTSYYHLGYHVIVAAFTLLTHANPGQVMLLFGQIILAAIPLPIYFFVCRATNLNMAAPGVFGVTLAAFGWFMPAHAVNWGKYPALLSLLLIQFTLGAAFTKNSWLFLLGAIASVLVHSRAIILLAIFGLAWILSAIPRNKRTLFFALSGVLLGVTILLIQRNQIIDPVFEPYGIWVTLLAGLLSALSFQSFPRLTILPILAILLMLIAMFIPVTSALTLLDRPLVEMTLFLPLAFLGGLGATRPPKFAVAVLALVIIIHAWTTYNFSPSKCCQLAGRDDVVTLDWMDKHLPATARIAIASEDLSLTTFSTPMQGVGTDAGIWVPPLTARKVFALHYSTDFIAESTHDLLCQQQVTHIYVGGLSHSFQSDFEDAKPAWYKTIFFLPNAHIVQTLGCE
jgi:hypothetical protein